MIFSIAFLLAIHGLSPTVPQNHHEDDDGEGDDDDGGGINAILAVPPAVMMEPWIVAALRLTANAAPQDNFMDAALVRGDDEEVGGVEPGHGDDEHDFIGLDLEEE